VLVAAPASRGHRAGPRRLRSRWIALAAIACVGIAAGTLLEPLGWNQTSHFALIRSLDDGTTHIDRYHKITGDRARYHGHWYSPRAPGLAFVTLPLVIVTLVPVFQRRWDRHRRLGRWTMPIWLYVSVTGVLVYFILYHWFPPPNLALGR